MSNVKELNVNNTTYDIIGKGVVDQNNPSTPLKQWTGTKAQYDAIVSKDANTIYNITDDSTPTNCANTDLSNLSLLGQSVLNNKVDLANGVSQADVDYVVESYRSGNDWYRLYKSGWIEQGGFSSGDGWRTITLLKEMSDANYGVQLCGQTTKRDGSSGIVNISPNDKTTTTMYVTCYGMNETNGGVYWEVKGMSAQGGIS